MTANTVYDPTVVGLGPTLGTGLEWAGTEPEPGTAPGPWTTDAACKGCDPGLFYATRTDGGRRTDDSLIVQAIAVCDGCQVRTECLDHALTTNEKYGVWGGTTPHERRALRRNQGAA